MAHQTRTFRIFVSSTFDDLKAERDALQRDCFPRLRKLCAEHGARFQAIDLRWGVPVEAGLDQRTMSICLGEIERCRNISPRPNFVVLLGNRYGWRPLPEEIGADDFERILAAFDMEEEYDSSRALISEWYQRDDNSVPPVYTLKPRRGEFKDHRVWSSIEEELRDAFATAMEKAKFTTEVLLNCDSSATEQEIERGALRVADADKHVFCFFRRIEDLHDAGAQYYDVKDGRQDDEASVRLERLKSRLRQQLPEENIREYVARRSLDSMTEESAITVDHLGQLCGDMYKQLAGVISAEINRLDQIDSLEKEVTDHDTFQQEHIKFFVGRESALQTIETYLQDSDAHLLIVRGSPGSGKSAIIARAVENARTMTTIGQVSKRSAKPEALQEASPVIVTRYIGATPTSSDPRLLLKSLCQQIVRAYNGDELAVPGEFRELVPYFLRLLSEITADRPLVIFIDAVDQLFNTGKNRDLNWLPAQLPSHVRFIASMTEDIPKSLSRRLPEGTFYDLEPMPVNEALALLELWLADTNRCLQEWQRREVLEKFSACPYPLYLKLAFEEARRWRSYFPKCRTILATDIPGLIRQLFQRLSDPSNHGEVLTRNALGLLAASKNGLSEDEILDLLSGEGATNGEQKSEVWEDFTRRMQHRPPTRHLPTAVWSRFYYELEPYLTERATDGTVLIGFYHRQLQEVITREYLDGEDGSRRHQELARYFEEQPLYLDGRQRLSSDPYSIGVDLDRAANLRKLSEQAFQETNAGNMWDKLRETLTDFDFIETKCVHVDITEQRSVETLRKTYGGIYQLQNDLQYALESNQELGLGDLAHALRARAHVISRRPASNAQEVFNWLAANRALSRSLEARLKAHLKDRTWLRSQIDAAETDLLLTIRGLDTTNSPICRLLERGSRVLVCSGTELSLYDLATGRLESSASIATPGWVVDISVADDKHTVAVLLSTGECQTWDSDMATQHTSWTTGSESQQKLFGGSIALSADGELLASIRAEGFEARIRVWRVGDQEPLAERALNPLQGLLHGTGTFSGLDWVRALAPLQIGWDRRGSMVAAAIGRRAEVWDWQEDKLVWQTERKVNSLHGMKIDDAIQCITISNDGCIVAIGCENSGIVLVNLGDSSEQQLGPLSRHARSLCFSEDDTLLAAAASRSVRVWRTDELVEVFSKSTAEVDRPLVNLSSITGVVLASRNDACTAHSLEKATAQTSVASSRELLGEPIRASAIGKGGELVAVSSGTTLQATRLSVGPLWQTAIPFASHQTLLLTQKYLYLADTNGRCWAWEAETGRLLAEVEIEGAIHCMASNAGESSLYFGLKSGDCLEWKWKSQSGTISRLFPTLSASIRALRVGPENRLLAATLDKEDYDCLLWDLEKGLVHRVLNGHRARINDIAFSADGQQIATVSNDRTTRLWDPWGTEPTLVCVHDYGVDHVRFLDGINALLSVDSDGWCAIWSTSTANSQAWYSSEDSISALTTDGVEIALIRAQGDRVIRLAVESP